MNAHERYLQDRYPEITPRNFYRFIFPAGSLEKRGEYETGKYTGIIVTVSQPKRKGSKPKVKRYTVTDDLDTIDGVIASDDFCIMSPISYAGKSRSADHARYLYAVAVDLDRIRVNSKGESSGLSNLMERHIADLHRLPCPTFIVSSGTGVHLYFVLDHPAPLYHSNMKELQAFKYALTTMCWHDTITTITDVHQIEQESVVQGFRMPGTVTKNGGRARAFLTGERISIEELMSYTAALQEIQRPKTKKKRTVSLREAMELFPEWYDRRIVNHETRRRWNTGRAVYDWWLRRIREDVTVGHRYYCVLMLSIFALKCSHYDAKHNPHPVTRAELERDAMGLIEQFDRMTDNENNHFTAADVLDALEGFNDRWITYPRSSIEYRSGITIPANKRNGRKQAVHLRIARSILQITNDEQGSPRQGRKPKAGIVRAWRLDHPEGTKADCIRQTGLDRKTVSKWWQAGTEPEKQ